jgi:hypothetical protein
VGRDAQVRRLSGGVAGARGCIPMPSEPPLAAETGHERHTDMPNQHMRRNSVTRRPLVECKEAREGHSVGEWNGRRRRARGERAIDRLMTVGKFSTGGSRGVISCDRCMPPAPF